MGVEFSCPTLMLLLVVALPAPWDGADSAAVAGDGSADSNGAATPAAASLRVSRRLRGVFIEQPPGWGALVVVAPPSPHKGLGAVRVPPVATDQRGFSSHARMGMTTNTSVRFGRWLM